MLLSQDGQGRSPFVGGDSYAGQKEPAAQIFEAKNFVVEGAAVTKALK